MWKNCQSRISLYCSRLPAKAIVFCTCVSYAFVQMIFKFLIVSFDCRLTNNGNVDDGTKASHSLNMNCKVLTMTTTGTCWEIFLNAFYMKWNDIYTNISSVFKWLSDLHTKTHKPHSTERKMKTFTNSKILIELIKKQILALLRRQPQIAKVLIQFGCLSKAAVFYVIFYVRYQRLLCLVRITIFAKATVK